MDFQAFLLQSIRCIAIKNATKRFQRITKTGTTGCATIVSIKHISMMIKSLDDYAKRKGAQIFTEKQAPFPAQC